MKTKYQKRIEIYVSLLIVVLLVMGLSYAYYRLSVTQASQNDISGLTCFNTTLTDKTSAISLTDAYPIPDSEGYTTDPYTFTLTNNCNQYLTITIGIESLTTSTITSDHIKAVVTDEGVTPTTGLLLTSQATGEALNGGTTYVLYTSTIKANASKSFDLRLWLNEATTAAEASGKIYNGKIVVTSTAATSPNLDKSGANEPLLADNMIPVYYDNANDVWEKADVNNENTTYQWYNYKSQMWANAVTVTSATRSTYTSAAVGTQIPMSDILGMWVWIPRYEYMTTNLGTNYAGGTKALPGGITIKFISGTSTTNDTNYLIHPAFRNGTVYKYSADYDLGGWDKELTGFWMGKFETGYATNNTTNAAISSNILVKPDVYSMRSQNVSNEYTTVANIQSDHGIGSTVETHMSKNDEWGAVAYLSQSAYGKYGNTSYTGANKEIYVNNAYYYSTYAYYTTGRSNGIYGGGTGSGSSQYGTYEYNNCPASGYAHTTCTETVRNTNTTKGTGASTTGNIYGVYDMSGGAYEYVMANYAGTISSSGFSSMPAQKYWNKYTSETLSSACNGSPCYGQAITETGTGSNNGNYQWYNDGMFFVESSIPWAIRGDYASDASSTSTGVFLFSYDNGGANPVYGVRASISLK